MSRTPFEPRTDRDVFVLPLEVREEHFDENGHVNNVVYVAWLQDAGTSHWNARFPPEERVGRSWYGIRHEVDYFKPILPGEPAPRAVTWVGDPQGAKFDRFVRIEGADGTVRAQGRTEWVLVDATSGRPLRVPGWMIERLSR